MLFCVRGLRKPGIGLLEFTISFAKLQFINTERLRIMADSKTNPRGQSRPRDGRGGGKGMPGGQRAGRNVGGCKTGGTGGGRGGGKGGGRNRVK